MMRAYIIVLAFDHAFAPDNWEPALKKFVCSGATLESAVNSLVDNFKRHNEPKLALNTRAVSANEIDAELVLPAQDHADIPTSDAPSRV